MKKFLVALLVTWTFAASVAFADDYPRFWKGDKNYPMVWARMGTAFYLDKKSVKVNLMAPPYYIITAITIPVSNSGVPSDHPRYNKDEKPGASISHEFFYDEDEMDMREGDSSESRWRYLRPQATTAGGRGSLYIGEAIFYVATGKKFYGNYLWKSEFKDERGNDKYWDMFGEAIYKNLR